MLGMHMLSLMFRNNQSSSSSSSESESSLHTLSDNLSRSSSASNTLSLLSSLSLFCLLVLSSANRQSGVTGPSNQIHFRRELSTYHPYSVGDKPFAGASVTALVHIAVTYCVRLIFTIRAGKEGGNKEQSIRLMFASGLF